MQNSKFEKNDLIRKTSNNEDKAIINCLYPSDLEKIEILIKKRSLNFSHVQKSKYFYSRSFGNNIFFLLSCVYLEYILRFSKMDELIILIDIIKSDLVDLRENKGFLSKLQISKEMKLKYISGYEYLIDLLGFNINIILNDNKQHNDKLDLVYDFYYRMRQNKAMNLVLNILMKGLIMQTVEENTKKMIIGNKKYKFYLLEETNGTNEDYNLIKYILPINLLFLVENKEIFEEKLYLDKETKVTFTILKSNFDYYVLYKDDQNIKFQNEINHELIMKSKNVNVNEIKKECAFCKSSMNVFVPKSCFHPICYLCIKEKMYNNNSSSIICCFYPDCLKQIKPQSEIVEFINDNTSDVNPVKIKSNKSEIINSSNSKFRKSLSKCSVCNFEANLDELYQSPECYHLFCYKCLSKIFKSKSSSISFCLVKNCHSKIDSKSTHKFFSSFILKNSEINEDKIVQIEQYCYCCKKTDLIKLSKIIDSDIYKCNICKSISCLIHNDKLELCFCFCPNCKIRTNSDFLNNNVKFCIDCKLKVCNICHQILNLCVCYCQFCHESIYNSCNCNEKLCVFCLNEENCFGNFLKIECGHKMCLNCVNQNFSDLKYNPCKICSIIKQKQN